MDCHHYRRCDGKVQQQTGPHHLAGPLDLTGSHALAYHGGDGLSDGPAVHPGKGVDLQSYAGGSGH